MVALRAADETCGSDLAVQPRPRLKAGAALPHDPRRDRLPPRSAIEMHSHVAVQLIAEAFGRCAARLYAVATLGIYASLSIFNAAVLG